MIAFIRGQVIHREPTSLIIDVGGIGYQILVPPHLTARVGDEVRLFCSHQVREDSETLYGFADLTERNLFELLLIVPGVGPKSALAILSTNSKDRIKAAIEAADPTPFESTPSIGKKLAAKIIVELKGKLAATFSSTVDDLANALESLGYHSREITPLLSRIPDDLTDLPAKIRWALGELGKR